MAAEYRPVTGDELADRIDALQREARALAPDASERLKLAAANVRRVSPEATYTWVDPASFAHEVETNAARPAETLNAIRNVLILVPLTLTWLALALAAIEYAADVKNYPNDIYQPFLQLWQDQFPHAGWLVTFTLSDVGIVDFVLLVIILFMTWRAQVIERDARLTAQRMTRNLTAITPSLVEISAQRRGKPMVGPDATVQDVTDAIKDVLDQSHDQVQRLTRETEQRLKDVAEAAQRSIVASRESVSLILTDHVTPMIDRFSGHLTTLQTQLEAYQEKLDELASASREIGRVAGALGTNAGAYMDAATQMSRHIDDLRSTQGELVARIDAVGGELRNSADALGQVAAGIDAGVIDRARETGQYLNATNNALNAASMRLEKAADSVDYATRTMAGALGGVRSGGGGGGLIGWLFSRGSSRKAGGY